jgi:ubiquitin-protein ligase
MLNPRIRAKRLLAEYKRLQEIDRRSELISIEETDNNPPDRYTIHFSCRGILKAIRNEPVYGDLHRVKISLTGTFPTTAPQIEWLTPIFHPNIREYGQEVCIGSWFPAKTLDQLVLMLGEMIQYKNYASHDPLNLEASLWAMKHKQLFPVDKRSLLKSNRADPKIEKNSRIDDLVDIVILD